MPVGLKSSSARTRPASRSRSRSKSGTRKTTVSKRSTAKVYTKVCFNRKYSDVTFKHVFFF